MSNIILIGMPGAGKSTVGVVLAKALGYGFIDTDLMIQAKAGKQLYQIIEQSGTAGFLELENQTVAALWAERCVIATGGSVVYGAEAMEQLKKLGTVVYLKLGSTQLKRRVKIAPTRGIVMEAGETLETLLQKRAPLYEKYADLTLAVGSGSIEQTVRRLQRLLQENPK